MKKTDFNLRLLTIIFVTSLIISNVVTGKLVTTNLYFHNTQMILPGAMFCYALTFLNSREKRNWIARFLVFCFFFERKEIKILKSVYSLPYSLFSASAT